MFHDHFLQTKCNFCLLIFNFEKSLIDTQIYILWIYVLNNLDCKPSLPKYIVRKLLGLVFTELHSSLPEIDRNLRFPTKVMDRVHFLLRQAQ